MPMNAQTTKRQHFLPEGYQRPWLDPHLVAQTPPDHCLWRFDPNGKGRSRKSPRALGYPDDMRLTHSEEFERDTLQHIDRDFATVRQATIDKDLLPSTDQEWRPILAFLAVMAFRHPSIEQLFQKLFEQADLALKYGIKQAVWCDEMIFIDPIQVEQFRDSPLELAMKVQIDRGVQVLKSFNRRIFITGDSVGFLTCDRPFRSEHCDPGRSIWSNTGPAIAGMPLSPRHFLLMQRTGSSSVSRGFESCDDEQLALINRATTQQAAEHVISRSRAAFELRPAWFVGRAIDRIDHSKRPHGTG